MTNAPEYLISIPTEQAQALAEVLAGLNMNIDLKRNMIAIGTHHSLWEHSIITGADIPQTTVRINEYLRQNQIQPLVREDHPDWSLSVTADCLTVATTQFNWTDKAHVDYAVWDDNPAEWQQTVEEYPHLFNKPAQA